MYGVPLITIANSSALAPFLEEVVFEILYANLVQIYEYVSKLIKYTQLRITKY